MYLMASYFNTEIHNVSVDNINNHLVNVVVVLVDHCLVAAHPVRPGHAVQPMLLTVVYSLVTYFYFLAGGTNKIYPPLDWETPLTTTLVVLFATALVAAAHLLFWGLAVLRRTLVHKLVRKHEPDCKRNDHELI